VIVAELAPASDDVRRDIFARDVSDPGRCCGSLADDDALANQHDPPQDGNRFAAFAISVVLVAAWRRHT
jgi:hypothetical protein